MFDSLTIPDALPTTIIGSTTERDYNVWVDDNTVIVTAYEWLLDEAGENPVATNTERFVSYRIPMTAENGEVVGRLLETAEWQGEEWQDYDAWVDPETVTGASPALAEWVASLEPYTADVAHDFEYDEASGSGLNRMDGVSTCRVCGIQYTVARWGRN